MIRYPLPHAIRFLTVLVVLLWIAVESSTEAEEPRELEQLRPLPIEPMKADLASLMGELQRLTHKLALSVAAGNRKLANFYTYESIALLRETQRQVPEYDGQPVALLIDIVAMPALETLKARLEAPVEDGSTTDLEKALAELIRSCNECHQTTQHGFIRITAGSDVNPFNQNFEP